MDKKLLIVFLVAMLAGLVLTKAVITGNAAYHEAPCIKFPGHGHAKNPSVKEDIYKGWIHEGTDTCISGKLKEWYCGSDIEAHSVMITPGANQECKDGRIRNVPPPPKPKTCRDTDGGIRRKEKGSIYQNLQDGEGEKWREADYCFKNGQVVQETGGGQGQHTEFYCKGDLIMRLEHNLDYSENCINGELVGAEAGCGDSDGGNKPEEKGRITQYGNQVTDTDFCKDSNGQIVLHATSGALVEFACHNNQKIMFTIPLGANQECKDGALIDKELVCEDTDGGINYNVKGSVSIEGVWQDSDYCENQYGQIVSETKLGILNEFSCEGDVKKRKKYTIGAAEKCKNGAIVEDQQQSQPTAVATEFAIDAWGFLGWGECVDQQGNWNQVDAYCKSKGYSGALATGNKPCYHEYNSQRWGISGSLTQKGSPTGGGYAFTKVKCFH